MELPFLLLLVLLGGLTVAFWLKWRPGMPAPPAPPAPDPAPAATWQPATGTPLHLLAPAGWEGGSIMELAGWTAPRLRALIVALMQRKDYDKALEASAKLRQDFAAGFTDRDRFRHAFLLCETGRLAEALTDYNHLLDQPQPSAAVYNNRGYTLSLLGAYAAAIPDFDRAIALDPNHAFAYSNRGLAYLRTGRPDEALADIERGLALDPIDSYAHRNLGIWHFEQQQYPAALSHLAQAHALNPDVPELADYLQAVRERLTDG